MKRFSRVGIVFAIYLLFQPVIFASSQKGYLGVKIGKLSYEDKKALGVSFGVLVLDVEEESPAEKAGIEKDDVIQFYEGEKIKRPEDLIRRVRKTKPKTLAKLGLVRDGKPLELTVGVEKRRTPEWVLEKGREWIFPWEVRSKWQLGLKLYELNHELAEYFHVKENEGVLVLEVESKSPADRAGIHAGDVILQIEGEKVFEISDVEEILQDLEKKIIEITLIRRGVRHTVQLELSFAHRHGHFRMFRFGPWHIQLRLECPNFEEIENIQSEGIETNQHKFILRLSRLL